MAFEIKHATAADATFSATGATEWDRALVVSGADVGGIPYCPTATTETTSANLTYTETSGPRLQVGSGSTTLAGWILGYSGASGFGGLWNTSLTPGITNYALLQDNTGGTYLNAASGKTVSIRINNADKMTVAATAGAGPAITAGTATTDVQALSATQTWNASGVAFTGWKFTITDTASAAGSLAMQILGGAAGTTNLISVSKGGAVTAAGLITGGALATNEYLSIPTTGRIDFAGQSRIYNSSDGVLKLSNNAISDFNRLQFGGTTSSFPAIKRNAAILEARLADDSAAGTFQGKYNSSDGTAGVSGTGSTITCKDGIITSIS